MREFERRRNQKTTKTKKTTTTRATFLDIIHTIVFNPSPSPSPFPNYQLFIAHTQSLQIKLVRLQQLLMAEGFESLHVPQQSRRDKLRVLTPNNPSCEQTIHGCPPCLLPFYDPSLLHSDLLSSATTLTVAPDAASNNHKQTPHPPSSSSSSVKEEGANNLLGYAGAAAGFVNTPSSNSSSSAAYHHHHHHHPYLDLHAATATATTTNTSHHHHPLNQVNNPNSIHHHQDIDNTNNPNNPFLYSAQNLRDFDDQSFSGGDVLPFKPQPLSSSSFANQSRVTAAQGLSLSLSSDHAYHHNLPLELSLPRYDNNAMFDGKNITGGYAVRGIVTSGASTSNDVRSFVPLGPFTGYASILKGSRFLKPAQQLLEELCDVGRGIYVERIRGDSPLMDPSIDTLSAAGVLDESLACSDRSGDHRRKKMRLISLLEEVYRRYKLYYQQMQTIVASFESVAGLGNAAPYASFAIKAMSKHFKCLKNAITDQLHFASKPSGDGSFSKDEAAVFGNPDRWVQSHRTIHNPSVFDHQPVWRPQRGLPERAVAVLRAWLFEHFLHPYPTDTDKQMLAKQTGLSRSQVSNWFINARVRLWKPMVEEIHMLETKQAQKYSDAGEQNSGKPNESLHTDNSTLSNKQVQTNSKQKAEDHLIKRCRSEVPSVPNRNNEAMNLYNNLSCHEHVGTGFSNASGHSGVSLTLGLRQNNGVGLSDRFPMNIARRFGVETSNEGYIISGFEGSSRPFGKDIGGQLLHDFVG